ncbi:MAG: CCA tRNA nucleotidyltransferase [Alphaproteobacteria bacterium]|nr:CCA tRNA nucleotidyltransferase [Alphaproteobacteria bacterium]
MKSALPCYLDPSQHPWMRRAGLVFILQAIKSEGGEARVVGGAVRDALLGRDVHDIDLAVNLTPDHVSQILFAAGLKVVPTGLAHGTLTVVADHKGYEITTLRRDIMPDGRRTKVAFTKDWATDAARRDFTFNALYLDAHGHITDYFDGLGDLAKRHVRFIGRPCERIREDVLRILRLFRFYAQIGGPDHPASIDSESLAACYELAHLLPNLSAERIGREITRLLAMQNPLPACLLMKQGQVLHHILPELTRVDRLEKLLRNEPVQGERSVMCRLASLIDGDGTLVASRLRLSKADTKHLDVLCRVLKEWHIVTAFDVRQKIYEYGADITRDALLLLTVDRQIPFNTFLSIIEVWETPTFPLKGKDIQLLGIKNGPQIGHLLKQAEIWWREHDFTLSKSDCLEYVKSVL